MLVFVHGESYSWGSANLHDGRVLAAYAKAVVVAFNYRLGVFGKEKKVFNKSFLQMTLYRTECRINFERAERGRL